MASFTQRVRPAVALAFLFTGLSVNLKAQALGTNSRAAIQREEKNAARRSAYSAFKAGDAVGAIATLTANIEKWPSRAPQEFELGRQLADVSFWLRNEGDSSLASSVASLSLSRLANAETRLAAKDAASMLSLIGGICEHVHGDLFRARQAYERAVILDPTASQAKERIARLTAIEEAAVAKAAANQILLQRRGAKGSP